MYQLKKMSGISQENHVYRSLLSPSCGKGLVQPGQVSEHALLVVRCSTQQSLSASRDL